MNTKRESLFLRVTPTEKAAVMNAAKRGQMSLNEEARRLIRKAYRIRESISPTTVSANQT